MTQDWNLLPARRSTSRQGYPMLSGIICAMQVVIAPLMSRASDSPGMVMAGSYPGSEQWAHKFTAVFSGSVPEKAHAIQTSRILQLSELQLCCQVSWTGKGNSLAQVAAPRL